jgi:hypothetical protein
MKLVRILLALVVQLSFFCSLSFAASTNEQILFGTASGGRTTITSDTTGTTYCTFLQQDHAFILWLSSKFNSGTSTLDAKVQYSVDNGANWKDLYAFAQQSTSDSLVAVHIPEETTHVPRCLRAVLDVGSSGSPNYSVLVKAVYSRGNY